MTQAIFLSYASQDADAARRICDALRAAGLEVWFDQSELRGGDAWDASIKKQIKECTLFVPIVSANTNARAEGYFRLEWKLAVDRSHLMADNLPFLMPVSLGDVQEASALVPERFHERQWTGVSDESATLAFASRVAQVLGSGQSQVENRAPVARPILADPATPVRKQAARPRRAAWMAAGSIGFVAIAIYGAMTFQRPGTDAVGSIAVLPFQTKSADADTDYLADGLAETLIYQLSQVPKLKVSPGSSVFRYKGKDVDPLKVGSELGVAAVMTGRLVQRGESLLISVELVDVRNSKSLWGEKYERKMADLLATQRDIALEIARKLQLNLSGESAQRLSKGFTDNNEAYQLYLKGQYLYSKRGGDNLARAIELFQQAVKLDANFAMAYGALANTYSIAAFNGNQRPKDVLPLARAAAERASAIDPARAEAHAAMASVSAMDWRWEDARQGFTKSIALNPDVAEARFRYALLYLLPMGRHDEATTEFRRAIALEPQATIYAAVLTRSFLEGGRTQLALENAKKVYAFDPDYPSSLNWLVLMHAVSGDYADALALVSKERGRTGGRDYNLFAGWAYAKLGKLAEAKQELAWLKEHRGTASEYSVGLLEEAIGNREEAFAALERAFEAREMRLAYMKADPFAVPFRSDPRFASLVKRMGLAP